MIESSATAVLNSGLLEQAASVLEKRLHDSGDDLTLLAKLGEVYRQLGLLAKAAEVFARLSRLRSEDAAPRYLRAVLAGEALPPRPANGAQPVPFACYRNYLPTEGREAIFSAILQSQGDFAASMVDVDEQSEFQPQLTTSLFLAKSTAINRPFRRMVKSWLPQVFQRLQMDAFRIEYIQIEVRAYRDGHFFRPHQDHTVANRRRINFSYFLHRHPRPFSGGDLLLYDTDFSKCDLDPKRFTRILPEDNCVVFYPSAAFHEATTVSCPADDFAASRFAIVGAIAEQTA